MLRQIIIYFCFILVSCFSTISIQAQEQSLQDTPVQFTLYSEKQSVAPNDSFWIALHFKLDDTWQAYWKNPGDAGMAPVIDWNLPEGFTVDQLEWPVPQRFVLDQTITFGYEGEFELLALIKTPAKLKENDLLEIGASVRWVFCSDDTCLPGESEAKIDLPVKPVAAISEKAEKIQQALAKKPKKLEGSAYSYNNFVHFEFSAPIKQGMKTDFFPEGEEIDFHKEPVSVLSQEGGHKISLPVKSEPKTLKGLLVLGDDVYEVEAPVEQKSGNAVAQAESIIAAVSQAEPFDLADFAYALGCAFLGGMILNLMPCVLPVVSFKVMSFVKMAGEEKGAILKHSFAFTFGVLISFWVLAALIIMLKAYGHTVGWGFQLQEPFFVAIMAAMLLIFGLSQFGVFELGTSVASLAGEAQMKAASKGGYTVSVISGVFATAVAAPCTGPFLGSALSYAITLPPILSMTVFTLLGLGMASPYIALAAYPELLKWMPKPGAWMDAFKQFMGFLMMATVLWLGWVFGAQTSENAIFLLLGSFLVISLGCWIYGKWGTPVQRKQIRWVSYALTLGCLAISSFMIREALHSTSVKTEASVQNSDWEPFSKERLAELKAKNIPFLIDFTAKWCLICQTNHVVLTNQEVEKKLNELGIVKIKADWTKSNPDITAELQKFGRSGVPLYVLYGTDGSQPIILPQVLTPDNVLSSLNKMHLSSHVTSLH